MLWPGSQGNLFRAVRAHGSFAFLGRLEGVKSPLMAESPERHLHHNTHNRCDLPAGKTLSARYRYPAQVRCFGESSGARLQSKPGCFLPSAEVLETLGGLETAHRLLRPDADFFSYGFQKLCEMKKADLTMEAMILDLDYADLLFMPEELRTANERLQAAQQMF